MRLPSFLKILSGSYRDSERSSVGEPSGKDLISAAAAAGQQSPKGLISARSLTRRSTRTPTRSSLRKKRSSRARKSQAAEQADNTATETGNDEPAEASEAVQEPSRLSFYTTDVVEPSQIRPKLVRPHHQDTRTLDQAYDTDESWQLGRGCFGRVFTVRSRQTDEVFAVKTVPLQDLCEADLAQLRTEIAIQSKLEHPNIVRIYEVFEDSWDAEMHLVMELCEQCLMSRLQHNPDGYDEQRVAVMVGQMLSAVLYCHRHGIVHRDIKLQNFMYASSAPDAELKLIDFGFACEVEGGGEAEQMNERLGTPSYMAPELCVPPPLSYDSKVDMWALGVVTYMLLCGDRPFFHEAKRELMRRVREEPVYFVGPVWAKVSEAGKDFVGKLLRKEAAQRLSASAAMEHAWQRELLQQHAGAPREPLPRAVISSLSHYAQASDLQKLALEAVAVAAPTTHLQELREVFARIDTDNSGTLTRQQFHEAFAVPCPSRAASRSAPTTPGPAAAAGRAGGGEEPASCDEPLRTAPRTPRSRSEDPYDLSPAEIDRLFDALDTARAGEVRCGDFLAATIGSRLGGEKAHEAPSLLGAFALLDRDNDGLVTQPDLLAVLGSHYTEDDVAAMISSFAPQPGAAREPDEEVRLSFQDFKSLMLGGKASLRGPSAPFSPRGSISASRSCSTASCTPSISEEPLAVARDHRSWGAAPAVASTPPLGGKPPVRRFLSGSLSLSSSSLFSRRTRSRSPSKQPDPASATSVAPGERRPTPPTPPQLHSPRDSGSCHSWGGDSHLSAASSDLPLPEATLRHLLHGSLSGTAGPSIEDLKDSKRSSMLVASSIDELLHAYRGSLLGASAVPRGPLSVPPPRLSEERGSLFSRGSASQRSPPSSTGEFAFSLQDVAEVRPGRSESAPPPPLGSERGSSGGASASAADTPSTDRSSQEWPGGPSERSSGRSERPEPKLVTRTKSSPAQHLALYLPALQPQLSSVPSEEGSRLRGWSVESSSASPRSPAPMRLPTGMESLRVAAPTSVEDVAIEVTPRVAIEVTPPGRAHVPPPPLLPPGAEPEASSSKRCSEASGPTRYSVGTFL